MWPGPRRDRSDASVTGSGALCCALAVGSPWATTVLPGRPTPVPVIASGWAGSRGVPVVSWHQYGPKWHRSQGAGQRPTDRRCPRRPANASATPRPPVGQGASGIVSGLRIHVRQGQVMSHHISGISTASRVNGPGDGIVSMMSRAFSSTELLAKVPRLAPDQFQRRWTGNRGALVAQGPLCRP